MAYKKKEVTEQEDNKQESAKPAKAPATPVFEKWRIDATSKGERQYLITAVKLLQGNVKIAQSTADMLNEQSHNNGVRYYPAGTVTNGNEETITIN